MRRGFGARLPLTLPQRQPRTRGRLPPRFPRPPALSLPGSPLSRPLGGKEGCGDTFAKGRRLPPPGLRPPRRSPGRGPAGGGTSRLGAAPGSSPTVGAHAGPRPAGLRGAPCHRRGKFARVAPSSEDAPRRLRAPGAALGAPCPGGGRRPIRNRLFFFTLSGLSASISPLSTPRGETGPASPLSPLPPPSAGRWDPGGRPGPGPGTGEVGVGERGRRGESDPLCLCPPLFRN